MKTKGATLIAACLGWGAGRHEVQQGPQVLQHTVLKSLPWETIEATIPYTTGKKLSYEQRLAQVIDFNQRLANTISQPSFAHFPIVIGGDHSIAVGTWSGLVSHMQAKGEFGLVWIDAHMDSHTPLTTPSHNIHGMPLAALLGDGEPALVNLMESGPKLNPQHLVLIGVRSFEQGEAELLKKRNVKIYYMDEVKQRGFAAVFQEARDYLKKQAKYFGVSLDIDALDPSLAPGTGAPEPDGIKNIDEVINAISNLAQDKQFAGLEIAEFDATRDQDEKTATIISKIVAAFLEKYNA